MIPRAIVIKMQQPLCLQITSILKKFTRITTSTKHHYKQAAILTSPSKQAVLDEIVKLTEGNMTLPSGSIIKKLYENTLIVRYCMSPLANYYVTNNYMVYRIWIMVVVETPVLLYQLKRRFITCPGVILVILLTEPVFILQAIFCVDISIHTFYTELFERLTQWDWPRQSVRCDRSLCRNNAFTLRCAVRPSTKRRRRLEWTLRAGYE
jgi:hypothetical protein